MRDNHACASHKHDKEVKVHVDCSFKIFARNDPQLEYGIKQILTTQYDAVNAFKSTHEGYDIIIANEDVRFYEQFLTAKEFLSDNNVKIRGRVAQMNVEGLKALGAVLNVDYYEER